MRTISLACARPRTVNLQGIIVTTPHTEALMIAVRDEGETGGTGVE